MLMTNNLPPSGFSKNWSLEKSVAEYKIRTVVFEASIDPQSKFSQGQSAENIYKIYDATRF